MPEPRHMVLAASLGLAACAAVPAAPPPAPALRCDPSPLPSFIGREATSATGAAILAATGASNLRWVAPGHMVTMEFREGRVTVFLGPGNRIERASCS